MFKVSLDASFRVAMAEAAGLINDEAKRRIESVASNMGEEAYGQAKIFALNRLDTTAQQYLDALRVEYPAPGVTLITLGEEAAHLESGFSKFDMKPGLLAKNAKRSKKGFLYKVIPMEKKGAAKKGTTRGDMLQDLKALRRSFDDKGITYGQNGLPVLGKVFNITKDDLGSWNFNPSQHAQAAGIKPDRATISRSISPHLSGVTKYQYSVKTRSGGVKTMSQFLTFRTVSNKPGSENKWIHPGFKGINAFPDLYQWCVTQLERKVEEALSASF